MFTTHASVIQTLQAFRAKATIMDFIVQSSVEYSADKGVLTLLIEVIGKNAGLYKDHSSMPTEVLEYIVMRRKQFENWKYELLDGRDRVEGAR